MKKWNSFLHKLRSKWFQTLWATIYGSSGGQTFVMIGRWATRITCAFESFLLSVEIWVIFRERQSNVFRTFSLALVEKGLSHFFAQKAKTVLANAFTQMDRFRYSMTWSDTNFYKLQIHIHVTVNTLRKESHWEDNFFLRWNLLSLVSFP